MSIMMMMKGLSYSNGQLPITTNEISSKGVRDPSTAGHIGVYLEFSWHASICQVDYAVIERARNGS